MYEIGNGIGWNGNIQYSQCYSIAATKSIFFVTNLMSFAAVFLHFFFFFKRNENRKGRDNGLSPSSGNFLASTVQTSVEIL